MASYLWRKYADYVYTKWERTILWDMIDPYRRPKTFTPLVTIYILAFYTGVIGSAITEQLYKEKYWEDHPGEADEAKVLWWALEGYQRRSSRLSLSTPTTELTELYNLISGSSSHDRQT